MRQKFYHIIKGKKGFQGLAMNKIVRIVSVFIALVQCVIGSGVSRAANTAIVDQEVECFDFETSSVSGVEQPTLFCLNSHADFKFLSYAGEPRVTPFNGATLAYSSEDYDDVGLDDVDSLTFGSYQDIPWTRVAVLHTRDDNYYKMELLGVDSDLHTIFKWNSLGGGSAEPPDNRLNWQRGDLLAVVYPAADDEGNPALHVYGVDANSQGEFLFAITQANLSPYQENPPVENTEIKVAGSTSLYMLTTGEFQLNIGPDAEGKVIVLIFDALPPTHVYSYEFR
jgi:hypothetical protein